MNTYWTPVAPDPRPARPRGPLFRLVDAVAQIIGGLTVLAVCGGMVTSLLTPIGDAWSLAIGYGAVAVAGVTTLSLGGRQARPAVRVLCLCGFGLFLCASALLGLLVLYVVTNPNALHF